MLSSKNRLIPIAVCFAATTATAQQTQTCPKDWLLNEDTHSNYVCCYGNMVEEDTNTYCCVYNLNPNLRFSSSVPTSTATSPDFNSYWSSADNCVAKIAFTASDYSLQVASASSRIAAAAIATVTGSGNEILTSTSAGAAAVSVSVSVSATLRTGGTATTPASWTSKMSGTSSHTGSSSVASATNAAMPKATAREMVLGGAAAVVAILSL